MSAIGGKADMAAKLLSKDEARRIAAKREAIGAIVLNVARPPVDALCSLWDAVG
jgi:hypothetical protein